jgi:DtxR family Mn-dependent transcriptional regulator
MNPVQLFRSIWSQRANWGSGMSDDCPTGVPVHQDGRCDECESEPLTTLQPGDEATVSCLDAEGSAVAKLAALGILPGARVRLVQRYPAYVFRLGYGEVAIDETLAATVRVRRA